MLQTPEKGPKHPDHPKGAVSSAGADLPAALPGASEEHNEDTPLLPAQAPAPVSVSGVPPAPQRPIGDHYRWPEADLPMVSPVADQKLRVFCGVWNLHGKRAGGDMHHWLPKDPRHHIYVIGTCECEQSATKSMVWSSKVRWEHAVRAHFGEEYFLVGSHTLSAIHIMVFIHRYLWRYCWNVRTAHVATGIGNVMGNKGGAQVAFDLGHTSILFINAHLAAHMNKMSERTKNFTRILRDSPFKKEKAGPGIHAEFDRVFFMGDLNPRVNIKRPEADELVNAREWTAGNEQLRGMDQLLPLLHASPGSAKADSAVGLWPLFEEAPIHFPPTYKFDANSDHYDTSKKQRCPSWTDRILWKRDNNIVNVAYSSVPDLQISDHRPIFGQFEMKVDLQDWEGPPDNGGRDTKKSAVCTVQ